MGWLLVHLHAVAVGTAVVVPVHLQTLNSWGLSA